MDWTSFYNHSDGHNVADVDKAKFEKSRQKSNENRPLESSLSQSMININTLFIIYLCIPLKWDVWQNKIVIKIKNYQKKGMFK